MGDAVRGDPQVDVSVLGAIKSAKKAVTANARQLDDKTLADIASAAHAILAVTARYQGVRQTQRTAKPGGGRRRR